VLGAGAATLTRNVLADKPANRTVTEKQAAPEKPAEQPVTRKKEAEPLPTLVSGLVKAVNAVKNTLTVAHLGGQTTFNVAKDATISIDDKPGALAGVPAGASVHLRRFVDPKTTASIQAEGRWLSGTLKAVDA